jgi:hypothetical protein
VVKPGKTPPRAFGRWRCRDNAIEPPEPLKTPPKKNPAEAGF